MKNLYILLFVLLTYNCDSQLVIKETKDNETPIGKFSMLSTTFIECTYYADSDIYSFTFKNEKYPSIADYRTFNIKGVESFNQLYDAINKTLTDKETKELEVDLGNGQKLKLDFKGKSVAFWYYNGSDWSYSMPVYLKHIDKIFGKA